MQFFIALGILVVASSAYLLHQFWSRSLSSIDEAGANDAGHTEADAQPTSLKAA
jgi:hypothetical protein